VADIDLLIDGDLLLYKAACGCEKEVRWDEENHVLWSNIEDAWGCVKENIDSLFSRFNPFGVVLCLTGKGNFRKELAPYYKANRQGTRKPLCYGGLVDRLQNSYTVVQYDGLEADDVMGILATRESNRKKIIVSEDKDMKSVPGTIFAKGELQHISLEDANYNHMYQTLIGDQSDGYPGCPGIGPVKAQKLLMDTANVWYSVVNAFMGAGLTEDDALVQARLARILRVEDWDSETKEPILWTPPTQH
jgi:5'-3' exonuclease